MNVRAYWFLSNSYNKGATQATGRIMLLTHCGCVCLFFKSSSSDCNSCGQHHLYVSGGDTQVHTTAKFEHGLASG